MTPERRPGPFYGWYVVAALFFATFFGVGIRQGFGVFVEAWQKEFGTGVAAVSIAASVGWLMNGLVQPFLGRLTDRYGGRMVLTLSMAVMGIGSAAMALIGNVVLLVALYGFVVSSGSGGVSFTPAGAVAARWFTRRRGTAMSLLTAGGSAGGLVLVPLLAYLLILTDWRTAWLAAGVAMLLLGVPLLLGVVRNDPAEMALRPDGDGSGDGSRGGGSPAPKARVGPLAVREWREAFRSAPMWQLSIAYWVCGVTTASIAVHYVRWASTEGISPETAALAFGLLSGINAIGVVVVGVVSDRMERKTLLAMIYLIRALAFVLLIVLPGSAALWAFAVVGGVSWLATVPLTTSLTADFYGLRHLGSLVGLVSLAHQLGGALAVYLFGLVFDVFGSYDLGFAAGALSLAVAGVLSLSIRERAYSVRYAPTRVEPAVAVSEGG